MLAPENEALVQNYLDLAVNAPEDLDRTLELLSDECVWFITPPGISFTGRESLRRFVGVAMRSRSHDLVSKIEIRNWFAEGDHFCVEYHHEATITGVHLHVAEDVCLVCHMQAGKFDRIHEYVDTSQSGWIALGLKLLPLIVQVNSWRTARSRH